MADHIQEAPHPESGFDMECPDENTMTAWLEGSLDVATTEALERHIDRCALCASLVVEMLRPLTEEGASRASVNSKASIAADQLSRTFDQVLIRDLAQSETANAVSSLDHELAPRQRIAERFEIIRPLGKGGMGAVYLAYDHVLDRNIALKTLRTKASDPARYRGWLQTFRREARAVAALQHRHIIALHDFGLNQSQAEGDVAVPYLVMEFLRGQPLDKVLARGPLEWGVVVEFAQQLAAALQHAHAKGVIHRCLLYTSPSPRDRTRSRMPSSA